MPEQKSAFVVSADWLQERLGDPTVKIVDASWYLPAQNRDPKAEYAAAHIPGAVFYDQDLIADPDSGLPHTIPSPMAFADSVGQLGLGESDTIVVYDGPGIFTAPRVWWLLRTMGATSGAIMRIFFMTGAAIGTVGTFAGVLLGVIVCLNVESIRQFFSWISGTTLFNPELYFLSQLPADMNAGETVSVVVMALALSFLATIFPAWRASKLDPVQALRYE